MNKNRLLLLVLFLLAEIISGHAVGQQQEVRISAAERGDKLGWVFRFHFEELPELYRVSEAKGVINLQFNGDKQVQFAPDSGLLSGIFYLDSLLITKGEESTLIQISANETRIRSAEVYPDINQKHLLLSILPEQRNETGSKTGSGNENLEYSGLRVKTKGTTGKGLQVVGRSDGIESWETRTDQHQLYSPNESELLTEYIRSTGERRINGQPFPYNNENGAVGLSKGKAPQGSIQLPGKSHQIVLLSPKIFYSSNSEIPWGYNDGALWQGKGLNRRISAGFIYNYGPLEVTFNPEWVYSENREFELSRIPVNEGLNRFALPLTNIDAPVRFGTNSIHKFYAGNSSIKLSHQWVEGGLSNKNLWTGPALYNPLLFSNNAPGFRHLFLQTNGPIEIPSGYLDARWIWGSLKESDYFDNNSANDRRYLTSIHLIYFPEHIKGLEVGFNRVSYSTYPEGGITFGNLFQALELPQTRIEKSENGKVHLMSIFGRYQLPGTGFEVYVEWGKNEHKRYLRDMLVEPEVHRGYVLGLLKRFQVAKNHLLIANTEWTNLESTYRSSTFRDSNSWYTDNSVTQGFTHQGQVLGTAIGPGSSIQKINVSYFNRFGGLSLSGARVALYNDRQFNKSEFFTSAGYIGYNGSLLTSNHHIEIRYGLSWVLFLPYNLEFSTDFSIANHYNRHNLPRRELTNHHISFSLKYHIANLFQ